MAPCNPRDQALGAALDGVGAGLAVPFAAGQIGTDFLAGEALEADLRLAQPLAERSIRREQRDRRKHAVPAARQQLEASPRGRFVLGLGQDPPADRDEFL